MDNYFDLFRAIAVPGTIIYGSSQKNTVISEGLGEVVSNEEE